MTKRSEMKSLVKRSYIPMVLGASAALLLVFSLMYLSRDLPSLQELERYRPMLSSKLYSAEGDLLGEFFQQKRVQVPLEEISPWLVKALIATEDRRFKNHWGIDLRRMVKAALVDIFSMSYAQGASTLTQQLARNLYLTREKSIARKLKEMLTAIQIERSYSKNEILEMYLTQSYFGHGAYGAQLASRRYFGKPASELTCPEAAMLVGLLKAPRHYSPYMEPDASLRRRNVVLRSLFAVGDIDAAQLKIARETPLECQVYDEVKTKFLAPYFSEYVRQQLTDLEAKLGFDIYRDGLEIKTTLSLQMQGLAEEFTYARLAEQDAAAKASFLANDWEEWHGMTDSTLTAERIEELKHDSLYVADLLGERLKVQPALVALDPVSGAVLSMIGGRDFEESKFNRAVQAKRQPGSAFKPFMYVTAIDNGYPPSYQVMNQDVVVEEADGRRWTPQNYDDSRGGLTTLREGLRKSYNLVSVRLLMDIVPPDLVARYAHEMGISTPIATDYTMALGSSGVYPIELVSAYACLANGGMHYTPYSIEEIRDREGHLIYSHPKSSREVLSAGTAAIMTDMLRTVIDRGTGGSARWKWGFHAPAAGKTGTTNGFTDAWFVGFTPTLACGVWLGMDNPLYSLGEWQSGGKAALPVWASFMREVHAQMEWPRPGFELPESVLEIDLCTQTWMPATPLCPEREKELFLKDYAPKGKCQDHTFNF
jgi:penicillin-binding protein 1A